MKKILGISFVAMLAVSPMMAKAELTAITLEGNPAGTVAASSNLATTSYVKGAYNALAGSMNQDKAAINTLNGSVTTDGSVAKSIKDNAVTATFDSTQTYAANTIGGAIQAAKTSADDTYQLKANSTVSAAAAAAHTALSEGTGVAANLVSLAGAIESEATARSSADTAINNKIGTATLATTAQTLTEAINEVNTAVSNAATTASSTYQAKTDSEVTTAALTAAGLTDGTDLTHGQGVGANLVTVATKAKANAGEITTLKGDVNTSGSVLKSIKDNGAGATYDNSTSGLTSTTLGAAITEVEGRVDSAETAITALQGSVSGISTNGATKEGVVATINHSTASGNLTVYTTWGDETQSGQASVPVSSTVTAPATNAYYATIGAASGTTQTDTTPQVGQ